jgi:hypothetical protein
MSLINRIGCPLYQNGNCKDTGDKCKYIPKKCNKQANKAR